jgi:hypothetical protein
MACREEYQLSRNTPVGDGDFLSALRLLFGSGMIVAIVIGFVVIRNRNVAGRTVRG